MAIERRARSAWLILASATASGATTPSPGPENRRVVTPEGMSDAPDTIVLVHGFWVTPRSWEDWITHYEDRGFTVLAPGYPGFEVEVEALNADPSPIEALTCPPSSSTSKAS